jgi:hypothetical protein
MFVTCTDKVINVQNIQETKLIDRFRLIEPFARLEAPEPHDNH